MNDKNLENKFIPGCNKHWTENKTHGAFDQPVDPLGLNDPCIFSYWNVFITVIWVLH